MISDILSSSSIPDSVLSRAFRMPSAVLTLILRPWDIVARSSSGKSITATDTPEEENMSGEPERMPSMSSDASPFGAYWKMTSGFTPYSLESFLNGTKPADMAP